MPGELLHELTIMQLVHLVSRYYHIKSGEQRPRMMTAAERKQLYNITPAMEEKINAALQQEGEHGGD